MEKDSLLYNKNANGKINNLATNNINKAFTKNNKNKCINNIVVQNDSDLVSQTLLEAPIDKVFPAAIFTTANNLSDFEDSSTAINYSTSPIEKMEKKDESINSKEDIEYKNIVDDNNISCILNPFHLSILEEDDGIEEEFQSFPAFENISLKDDRLEIDPDAYPIICEELNEEEVKIIKKIVNKYFTVFSDLLPINPIKVPPFKLILKKDATLKEFKFRRTGPSQVDWCRKQLDNLIKFKIIKQSTSQMMSPLVFVDKNKDVTESKNKIYRMCVDYKYLNSITERQSCSIPIIKDSIQLLIGNKYFAKMDLTLGYHQCLVDKNSRHLLGICTPHGNYEYNRLPLGPRDGPSYFQNAMGHVFRGYNGYICIVYFDDITVFGEIFEKFIFNLKCVLRIAKEYGLVFRPKKSFLGLKEIVFCGYTVNGKN